MATAILECKCKNAFQDKTYGKNQRVHNTCGKEKGKLGWRCTSCGDVKPREE